MIRFIFLLFLLPLLAYSKDCGEIKDNTLIRLDTKEMPLEGVKPLNQDSTGLCAYYTLAQILQPQLPFISLGRMIDPNYLGVLGYQQKETSALQSYTDEDGDGFYDGAKLCPIFNKLKTKKLCLHSSHESADTRRFSHITKSLDQLYKSLQTLNPKQKNYLSKKTQGLRCGKLEKDNLLKFALEKFLVKFGHQQKIHTLQFVNQNDQFHYWDLLANKNKLETDIEKEKKLTEEISNLIYEKEIEIEKLKLEIAQSPEKQNEKLEDIIVLQEEILPLERKEEESNISNLQAAKQLKNIELDIRDMEKSIKQQIKINPNASQISSQYTVLAKNIETKLKKFSQIIPFSCTEVNEELQLEELKSLYTKFIVMSNVQSLKNSYLKECPREINFIQNENQKVIPSYKLIEQEISNCKRRANIENDFFEKVPFKESDFEEIKAIVDACDKSFQEQEENIKACFIQKVTGQEDSPIETCHDINKSAQTIFHLAQLSGDEFINKINLQVETFLELQFPKCKEKFYQISLPKLSCTPHSLFGSRNERVKSAREIISGALLDKNPRPLAMSYCARQLNNDQPIDMIQKELLGKRKKTSDPVCGNHASTIIGMKCEKGKMSYLILNSWGDRFEPYNNSNILPGSSRKIGNLNVKSFGKFWIPEDDFSRIVYEIQDIR